MITATTEDYKNALDALRGAGCAHMTCRIMVVQDLRESWRIIDLVAENKWSRGCEVCYGIVSKGELSSHYRAPHIVSASAVLERC